MFDLSCEFLLYLAGFTDADGNICISKKTKSFQPSVQWTNTNKEIIEYIQSNLGYGNIHNTSKYPSYKAHWKPAYKLSVWSSKAIVLAGILAPYLIVKKERAILLASFPKKKILFKEGTSRRIPDLETHEIQAKIYFQMRELNKRGR